MFLFLIALAPVQADVFSYENAAFQDIGPGLWWSRLSIREGQEKVDTVTLVKVDPKRNKFRILYDKNTKNIEEWQRLTGASIIFNGSYFRENLEPCSLVISDGQTKGPAFNRFMKGMFLAEPKKDGLPRATIIDLSRMSYLWSNTLWEQGLQSFPMLIDRNGVIKVQPTELKASRTVICTTKDEYVIVVHTEEAYFTLYDLAKLLKSLSLNIESALNLDGGMTSELCIKRENVNYINYGYQTSNYTAGFFSVKGIQSRIPLVIGIFPRH